MSRVAVTKICSGGLIIGLIISPLVNYWLIATLIIIGIGYFLIQKRYAFYLIILSLAVILGIGRWQLAIRPANNDISYFINPQPQTVVGVINQEVEIAGQEQKIVLKVSRVNNQAASGQLQIKLPRWPQYQVGDQLSLKCLITAPLPADYARQLRRWGIGALGYQPRETRLLSVSSPLFFKSVLFQFKEKLYQVMNIVLPEPQASLLGGLLWGARSSLPNSVQNDFKVSGMMHQVAVSGFNTTIVAAALTAFFFHLRLSRRLAGWGAGLGLLGFVVMTGATASVMRAALMSGLVLLARQCGRLATVDHALWLVVTVMLILNPYLLYDIGWQLSVGATAGLVYLSPVLQPGLKWLPTHLGLQESLVTTLAATFMTIPVTIAHFGQFSVISPIANALTLPLLPLTMAIGAAAVALGLLWHVLGQAVGLIVWLPLSYLLAVPHYLSRLPWAAMVLPPLGYWSFILYLPLLFMVRAKQSTLVCPLTRLKNI